MKIAIFAYFTLFSFCVFAQWVIRYSLVDVQVEATSLGIIHMDL